MTTSLTPEPTRSAGLSWFNRKTVIAFVAGAALAGGFAAVAGDGMGWHRGMMLSGNSTAAEVSDHVDHVLKHFYVEIDATDAQKAQIGPLVKQAVTDLLPLRTQAQAARAQALAGLTAATVDRTALETARQTHLQLADQASKRVVQLMADVGDVLTPAQRAVLMEHINRMHGGGRS
jgi:Spy/CpxP family protein refolding chaperone